MGLLDFDEEYFNDEFFEESVVLERAKKMGIEDSPELRKFIGSKDSFSISDEDLMKFLEKDEF